MPKPLLCDPALLSRDLSGRRYVVTGANAGIGLVTAKQLALQGAHVVLACRRVAEAEARIAEIVAEHPNAKLEARELDLGSLASVRRFAERVNADFDHLDGLVNNAGVMNTPKQTTADGFEMQIVPRQVGQRRRLAAALAEPEGERRRAGRGTLEEERSARLGVSEPFVSTLGVIEPFDDSTSNEARVTSTIP